MSLKYGMSLFLSERMFGSVLGVKHLHPYIGANCFPHQNLVLEPRLLMFTPSVSGYNVMADGFIFIFTVRGRKSPRNLIQTKLTDTRSLTVSDDFCHEGK